MDHAAKKRRISGERVIDLTGEGKETGEERNSEASEKESALKRKVSISRSPSIRGTFQEKGSSDGLREGDDDFKRAVKLSLQTTNPVLSQTSRFAGPQMRTWLLRLPQFGDHEANDQALGMSDIVTVRWYTWFFGH